MRGARVTWLARRSAHRRRLPSSLRHHDPRGSWRPAVPACPVPPVDWSQTGRGGTHRGACRLRWREGLASPAGTASGHQLDRRSGMPAALTASSTSAGLVPGEGTLGLPSAPLRRRTVGGTVGVNHARRQAAPRRPSRPPRRASARRGSWHALCEPVRGMGAMTGPREAGRRIRLSERARWVRAMALLSPRSSVLGRGSPPVGTRRLHGAFRSASHGGLGR